SEDRDAPHSASVLRTGRLSLYLHGRHDGQVARLKIDARKNLTSERPKKCLAATHAGDFQNIAAAKIQDIDDPAKCLARFGERRKADQIGKVELLLPGAGQSLSRH